MFVYSGPNYRLCECGLITNIKSNKGELLRTGDIVVMYHLDKGGILTYMGGLSVVVSHQFENYSGGTHKLIKDYQNWFADDAYVMGIKEVVIGEEWQVELVKHYEDTVEGEHWKEFGFNYQND